MILLTPNLWHDWEDLGDPPVDRCRLCGDSVLYDEDYHNTDCPVRARQVVQAQAAENSDLKALLREALLYVRSGECFVTACAACADEATLGKRIREAIGEKPPSA